MSLGVQRVLLSSGVSVEARMAAMDFTDVVRLLSHEVAREVGFVVIGVQAGHGLGRRARG
jgi:hypothetical protein